MRRVLLLLFALVVSVGLALGQERTVTGVVTDAADNSPLQLASIRIKGTQQGTVTDNEGRFTLRVSGPDVVLLFEYTGYETREVLVGDQKTFNISLSETTKAIDAVVVTAFGSQKKSSLTGAIAAVDEKKLEKLPGADVAKAMDGQLAGVQISSTSGAPGASTVIRIRGIGSLNASNSPLIIVDGAPYSGGLNTINPSDIASWNVLKDAASAALYGARGANGVILITTKSGRKGSTVVNYDGRFGVNMRAVPDYDQITDPKEYYQLSWQACRMQKYVNAQAEGVPLSIEEAGQLASESVVDEIGGYHIFKGIDPKEYILPNGEINPALYNAEYIFEDKNWNDWQTALFTPKFRQEHTLSVSKGFEKTKIFFSMNYLDDQGYSNNSYFKRISTRLNVTQDIYSWLRFTNRFSFTRTKSNFNAGGNLFANPFLFIRKVAPLYPIFKHNAQGKILYNVDGDKMYEDGLQQPGVPQRTSLGAVNIALTQDKGLDLSVDHYVNDVATLDFIFPLNISFQTNLSYNVNFWNTTHRIYPYFGDGLSYKGLIERKRGSRESLNFNQIIDWHWNWDVLQPKALGLQVKLGHESYMMRSAGMVGEKQNIFHEYVTELDDAAVISELGSSTLGYRLEGYFMQVSMDFLNRYFLSGSFRMDGSSVFHPDHRWGSFWSIGASWRISQEQFFKSALKYVNNLKLRLSYGLQGNDYLLLPGGGRSMTAYQDLFKVSSDGKKLSVSNAYKGNKDVTWEKNYNFSAALEYGILNNMFSGELEFFRRTTRDMLFNLPLPAASGFSSKPTNVGDMSNTGVEFSLNVNPVRMEHINLDINFNITHYKNKVLKLPDVYKEKGIPVGYKRIKEGRSMSDWCILQYKGVDPNTGLPLYRYKVDGQWVISDYTLVTKSDKGTEIVENSREYGKSVLPDATGGFGVLLDAYGVDFSAQFTYAIGGYAYDSQYEELMSSGAIGQGWHTDIRDSWTPENIYAKYPRLQWQHQYFESYSDLNLTTASHLAFKSIMVGYTLPVKWTQKFFVQQFRLYFVCDNVWLWSARKGFDPRMSLFGGATGYDYMPIRTISGGIQLKF